MQKPIFLEELNALQYAVLLYFLKYNPLTNATKNVFRLQLEARTLPADWLALILRDEILDKEIETGNNPPSAGNGLPALMRQPNI